MKDLELFTTLKWNISVVIRHIYSIAVNQVMVETVTLSK